MCQFSDWIRPISKNFMAFRTILAANPKPVTFYFTKAETFDERIGLSRRLNSASQSFQQLCDKSFLFLKNQRDYFFSYSHSSLLYRNPSKTKKRTDQFVHSLLVFVTKKHTHTQKVSSLIFFFCFQFDLLSFYVLLISLVLFLFLSLCMSKTCSCKCSRSFFIQFFSSLCPRKFQTKRPKTPFDECPLIDCISIK